MVTGRRTRRSVVRTWFTVAILLTHLFPTGGEGIQRLRASEELVVGFLAHADLAVDAEPDVSP
jgi:hypothetical protein